MPDSIFDEIALSLQRITSDQIRGVAAGWLRGARGGSIVGTFFLGNFLYDWDRRKGLLEFSVPLLEYAAARGSSDADVVLGHYARRGIKGDLNEAERRFRIAAEKFNVQGQLAYGEGLAMGLFGGYRADEGIPVLNYAATDEEVGRQAQISALQALCLASLDKIAGHIIDMDSWLGDHPDDRSDPYVQGVILLAEATTRPQKIHKCIEHLIAAAVQRNSFACHLLGRIRQQGYLVPKSLSSAYAWFTIGSEIGLPVSQDYRDALESRMLPDQVMAGRRAAADFREKLLGDC